LAAKYEGKVEFLLVYIREAHPTDGWQVAANQRDGVLLSSPRDYAQKEEYASSCVRNLGIKFTALVDEMDAGTELKYLGWPDRLYLVGRNGRIAWKGAPGPPGFKPAELESAVVQELARKAP
jgi:hypothetical protein